MYLRPLEAIVRVVCGGDTHTHTQWAIKVEQTLLGKHFEILVLLLLLPVLLLVSCSAVKHTQCHCAFCMWRRVQYPATTNIQLQTVGCCKSISQKLITSECCMQYLDCCYCYSAPDLKYYTKGT